MLSLDVSTICHMIFFLEVLLLKSCIHFLFTADSCYVLISLYFTVLTILREQ